MKFHRRKQPALSSTPRQRRASAEDVPTSGPKFAYRARRADAELNIGRLTPARREAVRAAPAKLRRFMLQRFGLVLLLIALAVCTVNVLTLDSQARVLPLTTGSNISLLHDKAAYQQAVSQLLAASIWNRNKITVNTTSIRQHMLQKFPELSDVSVTLPLLSQRPIVYLQTAAPALILVTRDGPYVIADSGRALVPVTGLPKDTDLKLPLVTDQSGLTVQPGRQALATDDVRFIQTVVAQLAAKHLTVSSLLLPNATSELDIRLADQPYAVKFNLQRSDSGEARQQVGTFLATQAKLKEQGITPAQYIDVRVEGRAYYK